MKTMNLRFTDIPPGPQKAQLDNDDPLKDLPTTYGDLIRACINNVPRGGLSLTQMKKRNRVLEALEDTSQVSDTVGNIYANLKLEDEDVKTLKKCVKNMSWGMVHPDLVEFSEAVQDL